MRTSNGIRIVCASALISCAAANYCRAADEVGKAVAIVPAVTGESGSMTEGSPIHRNERISSSKNGVGQFVFVDGTKLAVGPNSTVVIDRFVFDDSNTVQNLTLQATKGTFRWISGRSKSSAYSIKTPLGTLGVRGTAFDFYVGPHAAAVLLLSGKAKFCGNDGFCISLERKCDIVVANPKYARTGDPAYRTPAVISGVKNGQSFPFSAGNKELTQPFRLSGASCFSAPEPKPRTPERQDHQNGTKSGSVPGGGNPDGSNPNGPT